MSHRVADPLWVGLIIPPLAKGGVYGMTRKLRQIQNDNIN